MNKIITLNDSTKVKFEEFPGFEKIQLILDTYPNLRNVEFDGCIISDFSVINIFKNFNLSFIDCQILDYSYPICLNSKSICFKNAKFDFEKFFFMTDMPNLEEISLFSDSIEGVVQFQPYVHLLRFFPTLSKIDFMLCDTPFYYDMEHTRKYKSDILGTNIPVLKASNLAENLDFINYMPYYFPKSSDGISQVYGHINFELWRANKRFWVNPRYMIFYDKLKYSDLEDVKKFLIKLSHYGFGYRDRIGREISWPLFNSDPMESWPNLEALITDRLRCKVLGRKATFENEKPQYSSLYGLFNQKLYNTNGHYILVNSRESIISNYYEEGPEKKLVNDLLPF